MKKKTAIFIIGIVLIAVIGGISLFSTASASEVYICDDNINLCIIMETTLPQGIINLLESFPMVTNVNTPVGFTIIQTNIPAEDYDNSISLKETTDALEHKFEGYNADALSNLGGTNLPFACPKDVVTGETHGVYLVNGEIFTVANDPLCPT